MAWLTFSLTGLLLVAMMLSGSSNLKGYAHKKEDEEQ